MKFVALISTHLLAFALGIRVAEWSVREDHATMKAAGLWLRRLFYN